MNKPLLLQLLFDNRHIQLGDLLPLLATNKQIYGIIRGPILSAWMGRVRYDVSRRTQSVLHGDPFGEKTNPFGTRIRALSGMCLLQYICLGRASLRPSFWNTLFPPMVVPMNIHVRDNGAITHTTPYDDGTELFMFYDNISSGETIFADRRANNFAGAANCPVPQWRLYFDGNILSIPDMHMIATRIFNIDDIAGQYYLTNKQVYRGLVCDGELTEMEFRVLSSAEFQHNITQNYV